MRGDVDEECSKYSMLLLKKTCLQREAEGEHVGNGTFETRVLA
jgi:hypothetical protein